MEWAQDVASPNQQQHPEQDTIMFMGNLDAQVNPPLWTFSNKLCAPIFFSLLISQTTPSQPVDGGLGKNVKGEISHELERWLGNEDNLEKWENGKISQMEKRILITHWAGAA